MQHFKREYLFIVSQSFYSKQNDGVHQESNCSSQFIEQSFTLHCRKQHRKQVQLLTALLCSGHAELLSGVTPFRVLQFGKVCNVKVNFQARSGRRKRGKLGLSAFPHLHTELPTQLHHPESWHSDPR